MDQIKNYVLDTNVLIENPKSIEILRNGSENNVFIPYHVLMELNKLKADPRLSHIITKIVDSLIHNMDSIRIISKDGLVTSYTDIADNHILSEIRANSDIPDPTLVTNDKILRLQAKMLGIHCEEFRDSRPFESESQQYTGFVEENGVPIPNSFSWDNGKPVFNGPEGSKIINYTLDIWKITPRSIYQNLALELMQNQDIDLVTIQSEAGFGKTFLALGSALEMVLGRKAYSKIHIIKPTHEIGPKLGYLPGDVSEKIAPYIKYIFALLEKLHSIRKANKVFLDPSESNFKLNPKKIEVMPVSFVRGMTIENSFVIIDETQNLSRYEIRSLLSRMGEGVKCVCLGDTRQIDNPHLNESNNGLNWIVKKMKGFNNYAHLVLKGEKSRGPITDMVIKSRL
ncbi:PhoH family protein [Desulfonatronovibrio hydrogenovorans]|uniref:PhoH family protein n=1 Tax=Desulfonatronovibrio hydrogenovorans TaxID=53245 RepID=UPI000491DE5E|nr:PhoH family protein [Desulfonatronovibrio hydrogenovorans]